MAHSHKCGYPSGCWKAVSLYPLLLRPSEPGSLCGYCRGKVSGVLRRPQCCRRYTAYLRYTTAFSQESGYQDTACGPRAMLGAGGEKTTRIKTLPWRHLQGRSTPQARTSKPRSQCQDRNTLAWKRGYLGKPSDSQTRA